jgi:hypothetical protein
MDFRDDPSRATLIRQIRSADTFSDVHAAQVALRVWRKRYPEDWGILDAGEQLSLIHDALLEDDSPPGQSPSWTEWQRLEYQAMGARTLPEITAARHSLRQWQEYPAEPEKEELVETLLLLLDFVEESLTAQNSLDHLTTSCVTRRKTSAAANLCP